MNYLINLLSGRTFQVVFLVYSSLLIFLGRQLDRGITNFDGAYYAIKAREIFPQIACGSLHGTAQQDFLTIRPCPFG